VTIIHSGERPHDRYGTRGASGRDRWIHEFRATTGERIVSWDLLAVFKLGWRIVNASPDEQAVLETHGFWSGRPE
jgi:hypothetical protein